MKEILRFFVTGLAAVGMLCLFVLLFPVLLALFFLLLLSGNVALLHRFAPDRFKTAFRTRPVPASEDTIDVKATTVDLDEAQK